MGIEQMIKTKSAQNEFSKGKNLGKSLDSFILK